MEDTYVERGYHSTTSINTQKPFGHIGLNRQAKSDPLFSDQKSHPFLCATDETIPPSYSELLLAAETLEKIVDEASYVGSIRTKLSNVFKAEMNDRVLRLVYGTMKFLPYIDTLLLKSQFLVFNSQSFLNHLGLVKTMIYDMMKNHFDFTKYTGINYTLLDAADMSQEKFNHDLVKELEEALRASAIKMGAAYSRLRIENKAFGQTSRDKMENILPSEVREREMIAASLPKTLLINTFLNSRESCFKSLNQDGFKAVDLVYSDIPDHLLAIIDNVIYVDDDFEDLLVVPGALIPELKNSKAFKNGDVVFQDKSSLYLPKQLEKIVKKGATIIDAKAGCGTRLLQLARMVGKKGCIYAFEHRESRLEILKSLISKYKLTNVNVVESEFILSNALDSKFSNASVVIIEPSNSGTAIVDRLGFMLQEKEFPAQNLTEKDILTLKRMQVQMLKHAFKFPLVKNVFYMARSIHAEETSQVIEEALDRYGVEWELSTVLPEVSSNHTHYEETLYLEPSEDNGNGIFLAYFKFKEPEIPEKVEEDVAAPETLNIHDLELNTKKKRNRKEKTTESKANKPLRIRLSKKVALSVARLSIPRQITDVRPQKKNTSVYSLNGESQKEEINEGSIRPKTSSGQSTDEQYREGFFDIGVYGISLKSFYSPRVEAIKAIEKADKFWRYPVPNPRPWK